MRYSDYTTPQWSTNRSGTDVPGFAPLTGLVYRRPAPAAHAHLLDAPCRLWSGSIVTEIPAGFGNAPRAMLAKGAPRLREPST
jgi:hypothetical protein